MKRNPISLTGVMIVMLIGAFYTFIFCMVGDLSDTPAVTVAGTLPDGSSSVGGITAYELTFPEGQTADTGAVQITEAGQAFPTEQTTRTTTARTDISGFGETKFQAGHTAGNASVQSAGTVTTKKATVSTPRATTAPMTTTVAKATTAIVTTAPVVTTTVPVTTTVKATTVPETTTTPVPTTTPKATTVPATTTTAATTKASSVPKETATETTAKPVSNANNSSDTISYKLNGTTHTDSAYEVVCRMVQCEMGGSFHEEALKAQAVATYSYMKYFNNRGSAPTAAMSSSDAVSSKVRNAVSEVIGQGVYYDGEICQAVYCASSGGYTTSARDVWGASVPYLVSVESEYDMQYDYNYGRTVTFSEDYIRTKLENYTGLTLSDNPSEWIEILSTVDGEYVGSVSIDGRKTVTGRDVREKILSFGIRSAKFDVSYSDGNFTFTTYGYGHGVGMPQNGANYYATYAGYDYVQILEHYYTGVTVK